MLAEKRSEKIKGCGNCNSHHPCKNKHNGECGGCVCELLRGLSNADGVNKHGILLKDKGANEPISLDGTGMPTVFFLEKLDECSCCLFFRFEDISGTTPMTTIWKTFIVDCQSLSGIIISDNQTDYLLGSE